MRRLVLMCSAVLVLGAVSFGADPTAPKGDVVAPKIAASGSGSDWPTYRGPNHDGSSDEKINKDWPKEGPPVLWRAPIGRGFSSVSVAAGVAYCNGEKDGKEACYAFDAATGKPLWTTPIDNRSIQDRQGGDGPRSTPTIDGARVYVLGIYLKLLCMDAGTGNVLWHHDLNAEYQGQQSTGGIKQWGAASSPVIEGDLIFVAGGGPGKSLMAFDKNTGDVVWSQGDYKLTQSTPTLATIHDVRQVIFFVQEGLVSVEPKTGKELWKYPFPWRTSTASSPVVGGDIVYCSAAYDNGSGACQVGKAADGSFSAKEIWRVPGKEMQNHWTTPVYHDGYLYGLYKMPSNLRCIDMATGKATWAQQNFNWGGATTFVDGCVLVQDDGGDLVLVEANPKAYHEVARCKPTSGQCWTMATISHGRIYVRSADTAGKGKPGMGEIVCLDVSAK